MKYPVKNTSAPKQSPSSLPFAKIPLLSNSKHIKKPSQPKKNYIRRTRPGNKQIKLDSSIIANPVPSAPKYPAMDSKASSMISEDYDFFHENEVNSLNGMISSYDLGCSNSKLSHSLFGESSTILDMSSAGSDIFGKGKFRFFPVLIVKVAF